MADEKTGCSVGIDFGIATLMTLSTGGKIPLHKAESYQKDRGQVAKIYANSGITD